MVRYTFTARDFHSLLFSGFAGALIADCITNACLPPIKLMNGRSAGEKGSGAHFQNGGPGSIITSFMMHRTGRQGMGKTR